jgi:GNAT superfamily N-acetyltransferase
MVRRGVLRDPGGVNEKEDAMATATTTDVRVREATAVDAEELGRIFYDAFAVLAERHSFPTEPASPEFTRFRTAWMIEHAGFHSLVAERDGRPVASLFADERSPIAGIGPVTVDPAAQDRGLGRLLMERELERQRERGAPGVRLVQTAYHYRSFALYAKLGFAVREPLSVLQGEPLGIEVPGRTVRPAVEADVAACTELARRLHGFDREWELVDAIADGTARVVERGGRTVGYATGFGYGWHSVAESNDDVKALFGSAERFLGLGVLVPSRNAELLGWALEHGLRVVQCSTLMTLGAYQEPEGAYLPSILF